MASIQTVINESFLDRMAALQKGEKRQGAAVNRALSASRGSEGKIITSVRAGSQFYSRALTGINFGISFLNFARADLEQISSLTDELIEVVEKSASQSGSRDERFQAQRLIQEVGRDIKDILEGAEVGDRKYLSEEGLGEVFEAIGLGPTTTKSIKEIFNEFSTDDTEGSLADLSVKGKNSDIPKEFGKPASAHDSRPLFDGARNLSKKADAYAVLDDLRAFSNQVKGNIDTIDQLAENLGENALLVRTTALAFLEIGDAIDSESEAGDVARQLQKLILKNARAALSMAENLEPLVVATLNYKDEGIVTDSESA